MAELLDSLIRLVCFGLSWPMNLSKNIKAKMAKNIIVAVYSADHLRIYCRYS